MEIYYYENCYQKQLIKILEFLLITLYIIINIKNKKTKFLIYKPLGFYRRYINKFNNKKIFNNNLNSLNQFDIPFISICIPAYNMEKYIEKSLLSIINQSFKHFEIIIVNDHSNDTTKYLIKKLQLKDNRIKLINHSKNLGVYISRVDAILASRGEYTP